MLTVFALLAAFQAKHFLCDFPLQGKYMLGKFKQRGWLPPLAAHCAVHYLGTFTVIALVVPKTKLGTALLLCSCDFLVHFIVDRVKVKTGHWWGWKPDGPYFWWALGADQMCHHFTHYAIIAYLVGVSL